MLCTARRGITYAISGKNGLSVSQLGIRCSDHAYGGLASVAGERSRDPRSANA